MHECYSDIMQGSNDVLKSEYADFLSSLQELQTLRQQNVKLIDDAERLAGEVINLLLSERDGDADWSAGNEAVIQHKALMEECSIIK